MRRIFLAVANTVLSSPHMPYPSEQLREARTIAAVGNGPVSDASKIDAADFVIRMNKAQFCGQAGERTDILVLMSWSHPGREFAKRPECINPLALKGAKFFWLINHPNHIDQFRTGRDAKVPGDSSRKIIKKLIEGRPFRYMPSENRVEVSDLLRKNGSRIDVIPSTGVQVINLLRHEAPKASLQLFGFSHQGWDGHCWEAERRLISGMASVVAY